MEVWKVSMKQETIEEIFQDYMIQLLEKKILSIRNATNVRG